MEKINESHTSDSEPEEINNSHTQIDSDEMDETWIVNQTLMIIVNAKKHRCLDDLCRLLLPGFLADHNCDPETLFQLVNEHEDREKYLLVLAFLHGYGIGTSINATKAFECYFKSAELGDPIGMQETGYCLHKSIGTRHNKVQAEFWYKKAAAKDMELAQYELALIYMNRYDEDQGVFWLEKSAYAGFNESSEFLAETYFASGDYRRAFYWYRILFGDGKEVGRDGLAVCHKDGLGTVKDIHRAIKCLLIPSLEASYVLYEIFNE
ncbi:4429_t:CDS:2 [Ambispora gerdemannii]|uniref:4429_t:CDS:1 n=1 Tax=Ambispora gerdemannii TaxID=144530 RepID=A0A9N9FD95_9GLOM|nr:4429_t:CDS:2 [Ambispora gerdemannii]